MLRWLSNLMVRAASAGRERRALRVIRARYDAAATTDDNRRHWAQADGLSANAANSPAVRRILRNRARYETANNSYARGIVLTLASDCVSTARSAANEPPHLKVAKAAPRVSWGGGAKAPQTSGGKSVKDDRRGRATGLHKRRHAARKIGRDPRRSPGPILDAPGAKGPATKKLVTATPKT